MKNLTQIYTVGTVSLQMNTDMLTTYEKRIYIELPSLTEEQLQTLLRETQEKHKSLQKNVPSEDFSECCQLLHDIPIEMIRREEKLSDLDMSELQAISHESYRKVRRMENYDWDVVEHSSEDNRKGFWEHIDYLERLEAAANLEMNRRDLYKPT